MLQWCWFAGGGDQGKWVETWAVYPPKGSAQGIPAQVCAPTQQRPTDDGPRRQVCLFVGGPLDGEKLAMPAYHVYEGHVIEVTAPGRESDYRMETWGVFEFVDSNNTERS
jgi:hypothetical protein